MKCDRDWLKLYVVTDRSWLEGKTLSYQVEEALKGGATIIQLREKYLSDKEFLSEALQIKKLCCEYKVPFIINDNVDIALACDADGVHVGQSDMEAGIVRERLGNKKIIGVSVQTVEQAILAEKRGANYLGVGAVFSTSTKLDAKIVSKKTLKAICDAVKIPVIAIGGISKDNIKQLQNTNIAGVAVVSAIFAQLDIKTAAEELLLLSNQTTHNMM